MKKSDETIWFEVRVSPAGKETEAVSSQLFDLGAAGVWEDDKNDTLVGYFSQVIEGAAVERLAAVVKPATVRVSQVVTDDWAKKYQQHFRPQPLAHQFFLLPIWDRAAPITGDRIPIVMEAGQAFGTGLHASTRLALSALESAVAGLSDLGRVKLLDVGTGTGILAIAAEKLGIGSVEAIDNDPVAVEVARENCVLNQCQLTRVSETPLEKLKSEYDVILSNILLETHRELASHYARLLTNRGQLIVAGLLGYQCEALAVILLRVGLVCESRRAMQEWAAMTFVRKVGAR
ncbi:MAG: 50S ribosomal protein L11 methyltransferase [Deltaproteobacteria bacterium]|nr:50S ribosomal protein L11 methyltransferase [Deltaproteobacteria bacterium]MBI3294725.1 50S ribosomal protein L11 methyltransferase [Deltaproteobacteria bacterium]